MARHNCAQAFPYPQIQWPATALIDGSQRNNSIGPGKRRIAINPRILANWKLGQLGVSSAVSPFWDCMRFAAVVLDDGSNRLIWLVHAVQCILHRTFNKKGPRTAASGIKHLHV